MYSRGADGKFPLDCPIEEMGLSMRAYNILKRRNIDTLGDIIDNVNEGCMKKWRGLGITTYSDIESTVKFYGYELGKGGENMGWKAEVKRLNHEIEMLKAQRSILFATVKNLILTYGDTDDTDWIARVPEFDDVKTNKEYIMTTEPSEGYYIMRVMKGE